MSEELKEFRVSNEAMNDPDELQRRIDDDGYLFFKRLQNPDKLRELRRKITNLPDSPEARAARDVLAEVGAPV
jgi:hypothetical protein